MLNFRHLGFVFFEEADPRWCAERVARGLSSPPTLAEAQATVHPVLVQEVLQRQRRLREAYEREMSRRDHVQEPPPRPPVKPRKA